MTNIKLEENTGNESEDVLRNVSPEDPFLLGFLRGVANLYGTGAYDLYMQAHDHNVLANPYREGSLRCYFELKSIFGTVKDFDSNEKINPSEEETENGLRKLLDDCEFPKPFQCLQDVPSRCHWTVNFPTYTNKRIRHNKSLDIFGVLSRK